MNALFTATDAFVLMPALLLVLFGCAVLLADLFPLGRSHAKWLLGLTLLGLACTEWAVLRQSYQSPALTGFGGTLLVDRFSVFFNQIFLLCSTVVVLISHRYLEVRKLSVGEYYALVLFAQSGMFLLATGMDLITLFVAVEIMSLCFYVAVGYLRTDKRSNEAALKYLLLGGFSSALLVYGFSLLYGLSGSTRLADIAAALASRGDNHSAILFVAVATVLVGLLFKLAAAPFHSWAPDAYEGAPTPVAAYLATGSKAAALALLLRILLVALPASRPTWEPLLAAIAVVSIIGGNLGALSQNNLKRLIAYSSIAHTGYLLLGLVAGNTTGLDGLSLYIFVYTLMNLGALLIIAVYGDEMGDLAGLMRRNPMAAVFMALFLLSLAGIPPTAGFMGKYFILASLIETGHYVLAGIASIYIVVSLYYYFRIVRVMFTSAPTPYTQGPQVAGGWSAGVAFGLTGVATLLVGIFPEPFVQLAKASLLR